MTLSVLQKFKVKDESSRSQRDETPAKMCKTISNFTVDCSMSVKLIVFYHVISDVLLSKSKCQRSRSQRASVV